jgi:hypothetical protein
MTGCPDNQDIHGLSGISLSYIYIISLEPSKGCLLIISIVPPSFLNLYSLQWTSGKSNAHWNETKKKTVYFRRGKWKKSETECRGDKLTNILV